MAVPKQLQRVAKPHQQQGRLRRLGHNPRHTFHLRRQKLRAVVHYDSQHEGWSVPIIIRGISRLDTRCRWDDHKNRRDNQLLRLQGQRGHPPDNRIRSPWRSRGLLHRFQMHNPQGHTRYQLMGMHIQENSGEWERVKRGCPCTTVWRGSHTCLRGWTQRDRKLHYAPHGHERQAAPGWQRIDRHTHLSRPDRASHRSSRHHPVTDCGHRARWQRADSTGQRPARGGAALVIDLHRSGATKEGTRPHRSAVARQYDLHPHLDCAHRGWKRRLHRPRIHRVWHLPLRQRHARLQLQGIDRQRYGVCLYTPRGSAAAHHPPAGEAAQRRRHQHRPHQLDRWRPGVCQRYARYPLRLAGRRDIRQPRHEIHPADHLAPRRELCRTMGDARPYCHRGRWQPVGPGGI